MIHILQQKNHEKLYVLLIPLIIPRRLIQVISLQESWQGRPHRELQLKKNFVATSRLQRRVSLVLNRLTVFV